MKRLLLFFVCFPIITLAQKSNRFGFPVDERTGRVTFDSVVTFNNISKEILFKRAQEFIAAQDFDRTMNIRCEDKNNISTRFYDKSIRYIDSSEGKILGSGFLPFKYKDYSYIYTVFDYKVQVKDNACKYEFSNFKVLEFKKGPKSKSRFGAYTYGFGAGSTSFSANMVEQQTLEEFMNRLKKYYRKDGKTDTFSGDVDRLIANLTNTMTETF